MIHLNRFEEGTEVTPELLIESGIVSKAKSGIKILGKRNLEKKITVKAHKFSASAKEAIESAGGTNRGGLMFQTISNFMRVGDIRTKIIFTHSMLIVFRLGTFIPVQMLMQLPYSKLIIISLASECLWWGSPCKLLYLCDGDYAIYHGIYHRAIIADGCCT